MALILMCSFDFDTQSAENLLKARTPEAVTSSYVDIFEKMVAK